ncbi:Sodium/calcium exchanger protein-domain-containing protein [Cristinia sonorae]|uniref:Vacuolar calcium ion transporter n=1 Tax=Cristinia sonorae TaxID=1940300 RepID=A0A8K0XNL3_9AGAR|nr:Sodium/calcium exchanger protein-domain-containing protein [Cristinia sonorae]
MGTTSSTPGLSNHDLPAPRIPVPEDEDEPPGSSGPRRISTHLEVASERDSGERSGLERRVSVAASVEKMPVATTFSSAPTIVDDAHSHIPVHPSRLDRFKTLFRPAHDVGPSPGYKASLIATIRYSPLNICLLFIPVSWALHYTHQNDTLVFVFSAFAILPLAALLGLGTEQIALRTSQAVGGLLNATLGNIVEMIIAGIALHECDLALVQSSLLGGLLSNLLLVLGMAFLVGGFRFHQQEFQPMAAQLNSSLMTVSVISLLVPAAFHEYLGDRLQGEEGPLLLQLSRGSAIILMFIYFAYLFFQFYSHNHLFIDTFPTVQRKPGKHVPVVTGPVLPVADPNVVPHMESPKLNIPAAIIVLVASTALAYETAENLVSSLNGMVENSSVSKEWLTLIVIPIISNAAEHATAVVVASKGKFDLAMSVAVGSCIQIALFVIPLLILVAWGMGKPLTLLFDPIETMCLFLSVLIVKFSIEDGKSHWMSGVLLIGVYIVIALSFWNYPIADAIQPTDLVCR